MIEAEHLCMTMQGVRKPGSKTVTSAVRGYVMHNAATRSGDEPHHAQPLTPRSDCSPGPAPTSTVRAAHGADTARI